MKKILYSILLSTVVLSSCNYLEIEQVGEVIPYKVSDYRALLTAGYKKIPPHRQMLCWPSDEVAQLHPNHFWYTNALYNITWRASNSLAVENPYMDFYSTIFHANEVIDKIMEAEDDGSESKEQILAEALALRAFCTFDLVNMYGKWYDPATAATDRGVPLYLVIDIAQKFKPVSVEKVYDQVFADINRAKGLMRMDTYDRKHLYRFSKKSLTALEARVRLYHNDWDDAYTAATSLMATSPIEDLTLSTAKKPYTAESVEAILSLEQPYADIASTYLSNNIVDMFDFETLVDYPAVYNDYRAGKYFEPELNMESFEYTDKFVSMKSSGTRTSFRSSEIYLIAAEAALNKSNPDIDAARQHLGALQSKRFKTPPDLSAMDTERLLQEVADERARELIMEGHRWFDLRRTTRPTLTKVIDGITYVLNRDSPLYILPFPISAVEANPELSN